MTGLQEIINKHSQDIKKNFTMFTKHILVTLPGNFRFIRAPLVSSLKLSLKSITSIIRLML